MKQRTFWLAVVAAMLMNLTAVAQVQPGADGKVYYLPIVQGADYFRLQAGHPAPDVDYFYIHHNGNRHFVGGLLFTSYNEAQTAASKRGVDASAIRATNSPVYLLATTAKGEFPSHNDPSDGYIYCVVVGAFSTLEGAYERCYQCMENGYGAVFVEDVQKDGRTLYRVVADAFRSRTQADQLATKLRSHGGDAWVWTMED